MRERERQSLQSAGKTPLERARDLFSFDFCGHRTQLYQSTLRGLERAACLLRDELKQPAHTISAFAQGAAVSVRTTTPFVVK
jgi:hypothetical protein